MPSSDQRQTLLDLAADAFARHGYAGASVRTITDAAKMNPAMVGYYFASKKGLFRAVLEDRAARIQERMDWAERGSESPAAARRRAYLHAVLEEYPEFLHILLGHSVSGARGFPADDCRQLIDEHRTHLAGSDDVGRLVASILTSTSPLMDWPTADRSALAKTLAPTIVTKRRARARKTEPTRLPVEPPPEEPRYPQPPRGDDFLDGFVD